MVAAEGRAFTPMEVSRGRSNPTRDELSTSACVAITLGTDIVNGMAAIVAGREMNMFSMNKMPGVTG